MLNRMSLIVAASLLISACATTSPTVVGTCATLSDEVSLKRAYALATPYSSRYTAANIFDRMIEGSAEHEMGEADHLIERLNQKKKLRRRIESPNNGLDESERKKRLAAIDRQIESIGEEIGKELKSIPAAQRIREADAHAKAADNEHEAALLNSYAARKRAEQDEMNTLMDGYANMASNIPSQVLARKWEAERAAKDYEKAREQLSLAEQRAFLAMDASSRHPTRENINRANEYNRWAIQAREYVELKFELMRDAVADHEEDNRKHSAFVKSVEAMIARNLFQNAVIGLLDSAGMQNSQFDTLGLDPHHIVISLQFSRHDATEITKSLGLAKEFTTGLGDLALEALFSSSATQGSERLTQFDFVVNLDEQRPHFLEAGKREVRHREGYCNLDKIIGYDLNGFTRYSAPNTSNINRIAADSYGASLEYSFFLKNENTQSASADLNIYSAEISREAVRRTTSKIIIRFQNSSGQQVKRGGKNNAANGKGAPSIPVSGICLQLNAYNDESRAERYEATIRQAGITNVHVVENNKKYRVISGPWHSKRDGEKSLSKAGVHRSLEAACPDVPDGSGAGLRKPS